MDPSLRSGRQNNSHSEGAKRLKNPETGSFTCPFGAAFRMTRHDHSYVEQSELKESRKLILHCIQYDKAIVILMALKAPVESRNKTLDPSLAPLGLRSG